MQPEGDIGSLENIYNLFENRKVGLRERAYLTEFLGNHGFKQYTSPEHPEKILLAYRPQGNEDIFQKTEGWIEIKTGRVHVEGKNLATLMNRLNEKKFILNLEKSLLDNGQNPAPHSE